MTTFVFANNAVGTLAAPISAGATSITLATGQGALFPNPSGAQQFAVTLVDAATKLISEIVYCTARSGDVLTVVRAQESTTALSWVAGDLVNNYLTAGSAAAFQQTSASGVFYATDTGAANALVVTLSPAPANQAALVGVPIYILVANTNTAAAPTLNANSFGAHPIITKDSFGGVTVPISALVIGSLIQVMWDGTNYQLLSQPQMPFLNQTTDGFTYLPNGTLIQWGHSVGVHAGSNISFDITFPTHGTSVLAQLDQSPLGPAFLNARFITNSTFIIDYYEWNGTGFDTTGTFNIHWIAIGY